MASAVLTNILLLLISTGLGLIIKVLYDISVKVNGLAITAAVLTTNQEHTQKAVDEHTEILKHINIKPA